MSKTKTIVGLDIGSANIRTIIAQDSSEDEVLRIVGVGVSPSEGTRKGAVVDVEEVAKSIEESVAVAKKMTGEDVSSVYASIGGIEIDFQNSKGVVAIGRSDGEVTEDDVNRAIDAAQTISLPPNREIIHIIPKAYRLDDQENIKDPLGLTGVRLEVDSLIIEGSANHIKNLTNSAYQAGIEIESLVLSPLSVAKAVLDKKQKELGVVLVDIGGSTTSLAIFEEGDLVHTAILPLGAGHITNDIAIGLRTSIEVAEKIKLEYGTAISQGISKKEDIDLSQIDSQEEGVISHYHLAEIIEARLEEIFELINSELKSIGKSGLLPAGAVLTGGGAKLPQLVDFAKNSLGLPVQIGYPVRLGGVLDKVDDPSFATAVGLLLWSREQNRSSFANITGPKIVGAVGSQATEVVTKARKWLGKFLP